jgi:hypothetical protein
MNLSSQGYFENFDSNDNRVDKLCFKKIKKPRMPLAYCTNTPQQLQINHVKIQIYPSKLVQLVFFFKDKNINLLL